MTMNDQLETELRELFAVRAAEVSADAVERLRRIDYRPRTSRRWPLTLTALGAASGTAAVVSVVVLGGAQEAFAGWRATPTTPTARETAATQNDCEASLPSALVQGSWSLVATDVRGPYAMSIYESGSSLASCLTGPSFTTVQAESVTATNGGMMVSAAGSASRGPPAAGSSMGIRTVAGGEIQQLLVSHFSQAGNGPYTLVEGRLEPTVSAVTFVLGDGQDVTATTGSGWLVAWWPGNEDVTSVEITSASGTTTEPLSVVPTPTLPPPASGGAAGDATAVPASGGPGGPVAP